MENLDYGRYMYELKLSAIFDPDLMNNCMGIIEDLKETRHRKVVEQQRLKFERLNLKNTLKEQIGNNSKNGHSNQVTYQTPSVQNKCWVVNLSNTPLSDTQKTLLAKDQILLQHQRPPYKELTMVTAIACQGLNPTNAEDLRAEISRILK